MHVCFTDINHQPFAELQARLSSLQVLSAKYHRNCYTNFNKNYMKTECHDVCHEMEISDATNTCLAEHKRESGAPFFAHGTFIFLLKFLLLHSYNSYKYLYIFIYIYIFIFVCLFLHFPRLDTFKLSIKRIYKDMYIYTYTYT